MALLGDRHLGNSKSIVNLRPMLSLFFLPCPSLPCTFGSLACQASPSKSVPASPDSFPHFPSLFPFCLVLTPHPMPILTTPGVLSVLCLFLIRLFISKSSERSDVHSMQGGYTREKNQRYACLNYRGIHLGNILLTFKQFWHLQAQR